MRMRCELIVLALILTGTASRKYCLFRVSSMQSIPAIFGPLCVLQ